MKSIKNKKIGGASEDGSITVNTEIARILVRGIHEGWKGQRKAVGWVHEIRSDLTVEKIERYMQAIAAEGLPEWIKPGFWTTKMNQILLAGIREGPAGERKAINKILKLHPELRPEVAWGRLRQLRRLKGKNGHRGVPFEWAAELDAVLVEGLRSGTADSAVSQLQQATGYPRDAILRRGHKVGIPKQNVAVSKSWTNADMRFLVESVQHLPAKTIAKELRRTEKAVWRKIGQLGLSAKCVEGYTITEILKKLHVWHARLKQWVAEGWIKVGRNGRITERSLRLFLREHRNELNWDVFGSDTHEWLLEFGVEAPAEPKVDAAGQGD